LIPFTKAHACGNDFLIVTEDAARSAAADDWAALTRCLCARNTGVGADGVEFFSWTGPRSGRIRLHNADGSVAEISGNGTRCVAAWMARERGLKPGDELEITTDAGLRVCHVNAVKTDGGFSVQVTAGSSSSLFTSTPSLANQWQSFTFDFTATSVSTSISLIGQASEDVKYIGLDNVTLTQIPEPNTLLLFAGAGLLAFAGSRRLGKH